MCCTKKLLLKINTSTQQTAGYLRQKSCIKFDTTKLYRYLLHRPNFLNFLTSYILLNSEQDFHSWSNLSCFYNLWLCECRTHVQLLATVLCDIVAPTCIYSHLICFEKRWGKTEVYVCTPLKTTAAWRIIADHSDTWVSLAPLSLSSRAA